MNTFGILVHQMMRYRGNSHIGNALVGEAIRGWQVLDSPAGRLDPATLYVALPGRALEASVLASPGNLLAFVGTDEVESVPVESPSNIILVPDDNDVWTVLATVSSCIEASQAMDGAAAGFLEAIVRGDDLPSMMRLASELMANPVAICETDSYRFVTHKGATRTGDVRWDQLVIDGPDNSVVQDLRDAMPEAEGFDAGLAEPQVIDFKPGWKKRICAGVWRDGRCEYILVVLEHMHPLGERDVILSGLLADVLAAILPRRTAPLNKDQQVIQLLTQLLDASVDRNDALRQALALDLCKSSDNVLLAVADPRQEIPYPTLVSIFRDLGLLLPDNVVSIVDFTVVVFGAQSAERELSAIVRYLRGRNDAQDGCKVYVSHPFRSVLEFPLALEQCKAARRYSGERDGMVVDYRRYSGQHLLDSVRRTMPVVPFAHPLMRRMLDYDAKNETELARTLYLFLRGFKDRNYAAERLCVHVNSVSYRVHKAEELFGIDLDDADLLGSLMLSYELLTGTSGS